jgi:anthranilate synthase component 2
MIMAVAHKEHDVRGVQFHPESVLTPLGEEMLKNWTEKK